MNATFIPNQKIRPATRAYFQLLQRALAFGRGFFALWVLWAKKELFMLFWPIFGDLWCPVVEYSSDQLRKQTYSPAMTAMKNPRCTLCAKGFQKLEYLNVHMQNFHGESKHDRMNRLTKTISTSLDEDSNKMKSTNYPSLLIAVNVALCS